MAKPSTTRTRFLVFLSPLPPTFWSLTTHRFLTHTELVADCFECCAQDSAQNDGAVKYVRAVLEICN